MKEATEFGIKYLRTMPDGRQVFVMHQNIWHDRKEAEQMVENLKDVVACPLLVEIWDPDEAKCLQDCPGTGNLKAEEPLPEPDIQKDIHKDIHREVYKSNPNGTVDIEIDGQKITDPEKREKARKQIQEMLEDILKDWPWFQDLNKRGIDPPAERQPVQEPWDPNQFPYPGWPIWLRDPRQDPWYSTGFSTSNGKDLQTVRSHRTVATC